MNDEAKKSNTDLAERPLTYELATGEEMKLTMSMVKKYLVTGNRELVTTQELIFFMQLCKARKLNPFLREAYLIKYSPSEAAQIITSIQRIRADAMAHPLCQGWQTGLIFWDTEKNEQIETSGIVPRSKEKDRYELLGAFFEAQPKNWSMPYRLEVNLEGYIKKTKSGDITAFWKPEKQPFMIMKVAESQGLRNLFQNDAGAGLYVEEELVGEHMAPPTDMKRGQDGSWVTPDYGGEPKSAVSEEFEAKDAPKDEEPKDEESIQEKFAAKLAEKKLTGDDPIRRYVEPFIDSLAKSGKVDADTVMERAINDFDGWFQGFLSYADSQEKDAKAKAAAEAKEKKAAKAKADADKKKAAEAEAKKKKEADDKKAPVKEKKPEPAKDGPKDPDPPPADPEIFDKDPKAEKKGAEPTPDQPEFGEPMVAYLLDRLSSDEEIYMEACLNLGFSNAVIPKKDQIDLQEQLFNEIEKLRKGGSAGF